MHDLIVIGGGPSGASAALKGAEMGLDVLLLEKEIFPRVKPCGGAVSERALSYIGFNIPDDLRNVIQFFLRSCPQFLRVTLFSSIKTIKKYSPIFKIKG